MKVWHSRLWRRLFLQRECLLCGSPLLVVRFSFWLSVCALASLCPCSLSARRAEVGAEVVTMSSASNCPRRTSTDKVSTDSSPISSKTSKQLSRKRKCPLQPKQIEDELDVQIIAQSDAANIDATLPSKRNITSSIKKTAPIGSSFKTNPDFYSSPSVSSHSNVRCSPLPHFNWADAREVWELMVKKDLCYNRDPSLFSRHPFLQTRMRSILLDWLSEVSEVYKLHRETFYLAIDFIDRYLSAEQNVPKQHLQLIGITCLFIAAKIEEIYPPKLSEFAYVTDGACKDEDILDRELTILKSLNWDLTPMTVNGWLCVYMQLYATMKENSSNNVETSPPGKKKKPNHDFMIPGYPSQFFAQVAHLLDLSILDIGCLNFSYSIIAAAALYHFTNESTVYQCTGLKLGQIRECVLWMTPFALAIREDGFDNPKLFKSNDEVATLHNIQSHTADLSLLERAQQRQQEIRSQCDSVSDDLVSSPHFSNASILTPPKSVSKHK